MGHALFAFASLMFRLGRSLRIILSSSLFGNDLSFWIRHLTRRDPVVAVRDGDGGCPCKILTGADIIYATVYSRVYHTCLIF
ncbi:hypothetical protein M407DRAFT_247067, partial [Tulasnella calospora MUT 4182]